MGIELVVRYGVESNPSLRRDRMRITFKDLERFAREHGYTVERTGRMIEWYRNNNHSIIGVVYSVQDAYSEIRQDVLVYTR